MKTQKSCIRRSGAIFLTVLLLIQTVCMSVAMPVSAADVIENIEPYQTSGDAKLYKGDINKPFTMMGIDYINGITLTPTSWISSSELLFNLSGEYELINFDIGHIDNGKTTRALMQIYLDGEYSDEVELTYNMSTINYSLNVSGVNQLRIYVYAPENNYGYHYALANITAYTRNGLTDAGINTIPKVSKTETVVNSNLTPDAYVLPYQYTDDVSLYEGDINDKYTMMGIDYINGITLTPTSWISSSEVLFNLGEEYELFNFDIGHIDNGKTTRALMQIYLDGEYSDEIELTYNMSTVNYSLNVSGVNQLRIYVYAPENNYGYHYSLANIKAYTKDSLTDAGITTIPKLSKTETVINSKLVPDGSYALPYQYTGDVTLYKGDVNTKFTMAGTSYINGITLTPTSWISSSEVLFNLGHLYNTVTFTLGHIDGGKTTAAVMQVFKDGVMTDEVELLSTMATTQYTVNTDGVNQLKLYIYAPTNNYGYNYGLADITAKHTHSIVDMPAVDPTCTENGATGGKYCETCKTVTEEQDVVLSTGHAWGEWIDPETGVGYKVRICAECFDIDMEAVNPFTDVIEGKWYFEGVMYAAGNGYMNGTNKERTLFSPNMQFTREQFVQLLFNMEGLDADDYTGDTGFTDVPSGKWYSAAVKWAREAGVTDGIGGGKFGLGGKVSREQLSKFLMNYAEMYECDTTARTDVSVFEDSSKISGWAKEAVSWAVAEKLIGSTDKTKQILAPEKIATRAEIAKITMSYDEYLLGDILGDLFS